MSKTCRVTRMLAVREIRGSADDGPTRPLGHRGAAPRVPAAHHGPRGSQGSRSDERSEPALDGTGGPWFLHEPPHDLCHAVAHRLDRERFGQTLERLIVTRGD